MTIDCNEIITRLVKYLVEGLVIGIIALAIPSKKLAFEEIAILALSAAATFSILDLFAPAIAGGARNGVGLSVGAGLVGGIPLKK